LKPAVFFYSSFCFNSILEMRFLALCIFLFLCIVVIQGAAPSEWASFMSFVQKYNKKYHNEKEILDRFTIFKSNLKIIDELNNKQKSARFGINKFADLSPQEFRSMYLMPKFKGPTRSDVPSISVPNVQLPDSFDWRDKGAVTDVYDQGMCGSCWAFSATEAIESSWFLAGNKLTELSPQQIVDCDKGRGDEGCNGGDTPTAYQYVIDAGGMDSLSTYPYTAEDDTCSFKKESVVAKISKWTYVTKSKNETEMQTGLIAMGPLSICVDAASWQFYIGGVITDLCGTDLDHCVLITGYQNGYKSVFGTYDIWLIRNSWGESWGESGYIYVERNYDLCGVADEVTFPIV
jgi:cathepsin F